MVVNHWCLALDDDQLESVSLKMGYTVYRLPQIFVLWIRKWLGKPLEFEVAHLWKIRHLNMLWSAWGHLAQNSTSWLGDFYVGRSGKILFFLVFVWLRTMPILRISGIWNGYSTFVAWPWICRLWDCVFFWKQLPAHCVVLVVHISGKDLEMSFLTLRRGCFDTPDGFCYPKYFVHYLAILYIYIHIYTHIYVSW